MTDPARIEPRNLRKERLAKGLCPDCGEEAAPYRLCDRCRFKKKILYFMNKAVVAGDVIKSKDGRQSAWQCHPDRRGENSWRTSYWETGPDDKRNLPRLRNLPIDVEKQLVQIFIDAGKPLTMEEVYAAWGTLRLRAGRTSAAMDLAHIVDAKRKRAAKMARRAERHRKQIAAEAERRTNA